MVMTTSQKEDQVNGKYWDQVSGSRKTNGIRSHLTRCRKICRINATGSRELEIARIKEINGIEITRCRQMSGIRVTISQEMSGIRVTISQEMNGTSLSTRITKG